MHDRKAYRILDQIHPESSEDDACLSNSTSQKKQKQYRSVIFVENVNSKNIQLNRERGGGGLRN